MYEAEGWIAEDARGWFLTACVAPPRQKAAEERNFSPKVCERVGELRRDEEKTRRRNGSGGGWGRTGVERTGAEREGGGKAGRPGIDRLKKGWIFLPLGGGPDV